MLWSVPRMHIAPGPVTPGCFCQSFSVKLNSNAVNCWGSPVTPEISMGSGPPWFDGTGVHWVRNTSVYWWVWCARPWNPYSPGSRCPSALPGWGRTPLVGSAEWVCVLHFLWVRTKGSYKRIRDPPTPSGELPTRDWSSNSPGRTPFLPCNSCTHSCRTEVGFPSHAFSVITQEKTLF